MPENWWDNIGPVSKPHLLPSDPLSLSGSPLSLGAGADQLQSSPGALNRSQPAAAGGGFDWGGAAELGAPIIASLLTGSGKNPAAGAATKDTAALSSMGMQLSSQGSAALAPVLQYLKQVLGGDPAALQAATQPQRVRILDQYDTARQTIARNSPRGGGGAAAMSQVNAAQAHDLAGTASTARNAAVGDLGQIGANLTSEGLSATANASQLESAQAEQTRQQHAGFGKALGGWLGTALPFILGAL